MAELRGMVFCLSWVEKRLYQCRVKKRKNESWDTKYPLVCRGLEAKPSHLVTYKLFMMRGTWKVVFLPHNFLFTSLSLPFEKRFLRAGRETLLRHTRRTISVFQGKRYQHGRSRIVELGLQTSEDGQRKPETRIPTAIASLRTPKSKTPS